MIRMNSRTVLLASAFAHLAMLAWGVTSAQAAQDISTPSITSYPFGGCLDPAYAVSFTGTATNDDDGNGADFVSAVVYDGALHVVDVFDGDINGTVGDFIDYSVLSGLTSGPIKVRVHDTSYEVAALGGDLDWMSTSPVLAQFVIDPLTDFPSCAGSLPPGPEIRLEGISSPGNVILYSAGTTIVDSTTVDVPEHAQLVVSYSAECAVEGPMSSWVGVELLVDGVAIKPTSGFYALCAGKGTSGLDQWFSGRAIGATVVSPGRHTVEARGSGRGGALGWWWGDRTMAITVPEPGANMMLAFGLLMLPVCARFRSRKHRGTFGSTLSSCALALCVVSGVGAATESQAQTIVSSETHGLVQSIPYNGTTLLALNELGSTRHTVFNPTSWKRVQLTYTAECQVFSNIATNTFVELEISVDNVALEPTGTDFAFCTSDGMGGGNWVSGSVTAFADLAPSSVVKNIRVRARLRGAEQGEQATIDDTSLIVLQTPIAAP